MNYTTLIAGKATEGSIRSWVNAETVPAIDVVADTEDWMNRNLRVRKMQQRLSFVLPLGTSDIDLTEMAPDLLDPIRLHVNGFGDLTFIPEDEIDARRAVGTDGELSESAPHYWAIVGEFLLFDVKADEDYFITLTYYRRPNPLSPTTQANFYTREWRNAFKFAALGFAYLFLKDEQRATAMFSLAQGVIQQGAMNDDLTRRGMSFDVTVS